MKKSTFTQKDLLNLISLQISFGLGVSVFSTPVASVFEINKMKKPVDQLQSELNKVGLKSEVNLNDLLICIYK